MGPDAAAPGLIFFCARTGRVTLQRCHSPRMAACEIGKEIGMIWTKTLGAKLMVLTLGDLDILKQLRGAGVSGRNVRELNIRVTLDRLAKGGYVVGRPIGRDSVQYRITQRG
jgi:hypothetical protein